MTFTTRNLTGDRVMVKGTDIDGAVGETVLNATQWHELKARQDVKEQGEAFDRAVEEFYKPLLEAAEAVGKAYERPTDEIAVVVLDEGEEHVAGRAPQIVHLNKDSVVLRILESGNTDRLIWVDGELEVLEILPGTGNTGVVASGAEVIGEENMPAEDDPFA